MNHVTLGALMVEGLQVSVYQLYLKAVLTIQVLLSKIEFIPTTALE